MIEAYAFLAAFPLQILAMSVLYPAWFIRYLRLQAMKIPAERLAQLYPGIDPGLARERFFARYRTLNAGIAVLGLLLLAWMFTFMQHPDQDNGPMDAIVGVYFVVQAVLPLCFVVWHGVRSNKDYRRALLEGKRKAVLQRRGLFDFVSPLMVFLAALSYFLFVAFVIYIQQHPFPGFSGIVSIGVVTLIYAIQASIVYATLYGKKFNPFETHAGRVRSIGLVVRSCVYSCIGCVVFISIYSTLGLLDLRGWEPFSLSVFFVATALLSLMGMAHGRASPG